MGHLWENHVRIGDTFGRFNVRIGYILRNSPVSGTFLVILQFLVLVENIPVSVLLETIPVSVHSEILQFNSMEFHGTFLYSWDIPVFLLSSPFLRTFPSFPAFPYFPSFPLFLEHWGITASPARVPVLSHPGYTLAVLRSTPVMGVLQHGGSRNG